MEVDEIIQEALGMDGYSCWDVEGWGDDGAYPYEISLAGYTEAEKGEVGKFLASAGKRGNGAVGKLLCELALRHLVPEGHYLITLTGW